MVAVRAVELSLLWWQRVQTKITQEGCFRIVVERAEALPTLVPRVGGAADEEVFSSSDVEAILAG